MATFEFKAIFRLRELLIENGIPFEFESLYDGHKLTIRDNRGCKLCDAVEHFMSLGSEHDQLEVFGGTTKSEGEVMGHLEPEEVFKRFRYCWLNNTPFYRRGQ